MFERKKKYTKKENRRRYKLHYKARKYGAEICTAEKTCKVAPGGEINPFIKKLVDEFNYGVQAVIAPPENLLKKKTDKL